MAISPVLLASEAVNDAGTWLANIPQGKYEAFALILTADAEAASLATEADLGRVRVSESGRDLVNIDWTWLRSINSLKGGNIHRNFTVAAGVTEAIGIIPRGFYDDNVHRVLETDLAQVSVTHGALWATHIETATWKLYGLLRQTGEMRYNLRINQIDIQMSAAGVYTNQIRDENVVALYIEFSASLEQVRVVQDGEAAVNAVRSEDLCDISDALNNTDSLTDAVLQESYGLTRSCLFELQLANPGEVGEFLSDDVTVELTASGAITPESVIVFSADFSPTKLQETKFQNKAVMQRKFARKNTLARTRPLQALRIAAEG